VSDPVALTVHKRSPLAELAAGLRLAAAAIEQLEQTGQSKPAAAAAETNDDAMTPKAAATNLGISERMVYKLVKGGQLKALHIGASIRIAPSELQAFRKRRTR
jgi:excisionase family DNA binding protein